MKKIAPYLIILIFIGTFIIIYVSSIKKIAYIDTNKVIKEYKLTEEINKEVKQFEENRKNIIDSLANEIKEIQQGSIKLENEKIEQLKANYFEKREKFLIEINQVKQNGIDKVVDKINQNVIDFGKENNYDIIFGANGDGAIMFAKDTYNITEEIIKYLNAKHEGH